MENIESTPSQAGRDSAGLCLMRGFFYRSVTVGRRVLEIPAMESLSKRMMPLYDGLGWTVTEFLVVTHRSWDMGQSLLLAPKRC
jgi:hypothetical protein